MFRTALRNVLAHKARLLMTVLAVMLGVAFVSGTLVFTSTISQASQGAMQQSFRDVDVAIQPRSGDDTGTPALLDQKLLDKAARVPGAASATGLIHGFTALADKKGELIGDASHSEGGNYAPGTGGKDARYPMRDGAPPHGPHEFALDAHTADKAGYKVGDTVRISTNGPVHEQKLTGIFTADTHQVPPGSSLALFDTPTAQKLLGAPHGFHKIQLKADPGTSQTALKSAVESVLPKGQAEVSTGKQLSDDLAKMIESESKDMQRYLLVFAGISLFVGIFLIANTFTMLVAQRTRELALLRAVGASRRQVTRSVLLEAFVVGLIASVVGLAAGVGIGAGLRSLVGSMSATTPDGPLVIPSSAVVTSLLVGVLITVLAAWLPGRRAAKIPPVAAMNSVHATPTTNSLVVRNTLGSLVAGAGTAGVLAATNIDNADSSTQLMALSAAVVMTGVFILTPLLSRPMIALAAPVLRVFGVAGTLARLNAVRNPRRTAATASALMIGLTLITGLTVIATSVQKDVEKRAVASLKADYVVSMAGGGPLSPEVAKKLGTVDEVTAVSPLRHSAVGGADQTMLTAVDGSAFGRLTRLHFTQGSLGRIQGDRVVVDEMTAANESLHLGSRIPVTYDDGTKSTLTVSGVYEPSDILMGVVVDNATVAAHQKQAVDTRVLVKTRDGASAAAKDALVTALGKNPAISVAAKQQVSEQIAGQITMMLNVLYGLLGMAVVVAVLGVINTLAMSVFERAQEIGMLRAIGLDRPGIKQMVRLESLVISLFGGVLGIGLGVFFGWAGGEVLNGALTGYEMVLPWGRIGLFLAVAALIGALAALWPARRAARLNMLEAIKAE
ncbi:ABC transporter permease [Streptomyces platensis]|uniref:ABC transporter permease n=1 Tax=Streptomyces platensis TaxID=58346 RepID=UPI001F2E17C8|nr:ABC transporter permease [Streptomyces platensis]MCF3145412.1 ABC transporter permease [Streptomyces platensis]